MIRRIALDECTPMNGAEPNCSEDTETWVGNIIETKSDKGVLVSLLNAGLATTFGFGDEKVVRLTDEGLRVYKSL